MLEASQPTTWTFVLFVLAYLLGGCSPGYWLVHWFTGGDVRTQGSGTTGATNAGRVLGRAGFVAVLLLDVAKGALCVGAARWLEESLPAQSAIALAVVAGHVWPVQLGFRGGKGIAALLGAWLVLAPLALIPCLIAAVLAYAVLRRFNVAGLFGLTFLPFSTLWATGTRAGALISAVLLLVVVYAHREHLRGPIWRRSETP